MYIDNSFNTNKQSSKNFKNIQKILDEHAKWQIRDFSISDIEATVNKKSKFISYKDNNTNKNSIEKTFESITKYDFPCKETLSSLIYFSKYNSSNLRLATIDLCNIGGIIYAISKTYSI